MWDKIDKMIYWTRGRFSCPNSRYMRIKMSKKQDLESRLKIRTYGCKLLIYERNSDAIPFRLFYVSYIRQVSIFFIVI